MSRQAGIRRLVTAQGRVVLVLWCLGGVAVTGGVSIRIYAPSRYRTASLFAKHLHHQLPARCTLAQPPT